MPMNPQVGILWLAAGIRLQYTLSSDRECGLPMGRTRQSTGVSMQMRGTG